MADIAIEHVSKVFKGKTAPAVYDLNLEVQDGEFLVLVGPSGCGKTTTLRMLAGFETPSIGAIRIGGKLMNNVPPKDRNLAMVFQNYALFPHMTVMKNLTFGLKIRHTPKSQALRDAEEIAGMLGISELLGRKPAELSGGERQRVALGRALLRRPQVFLMDEPLSNLDAALRAQMRTELKRIHAQFPVTTVYVTHDQVEAMTMADRVALMRAGRAQQVVSPEVMYDRPANVFVASFIGTPKINLLSGSLELGEGAVVLRFLRCACTLEDALAKRLYGASPPTSVLVGFRPEEIGLARSEANGAPIAKAKVELVEPLGSETHVVATIDGERVICKLPAHAGVSVGETIPLEFSLSQIKLFDRESGGRLD